MGWPLSLVAVRHGTTEASSVGSPGLAAFPVAVRHGTTEASSVGKNVALLAAYYVPAALREEAALSAELPEYRQYARRTKRFVPYVV